MRFVTWNCCEGFDRDLTHLQAIDCDVAVLAEVPRPAPQPSMIDTAVEWHWTGHYERKGLALAGFGNALTPLDSRSDAGTHCIAADTPFALGVLGIWSCPPAGSTYGAQVKAAIRAHYDWLAEKPCIVAGDFNVAPAVPRTPGPVFYERSFQTSLTSAT